MSTKTKFTAEQEQALNEVLSAHGLSYAAFMELRPDSYEHVLAAHDPEQLELLYSILLTPAMSLLQQRELAPAWPSGPKDGSKPSTGTLSGIGQRIRTERMLSNVEVQAKIMQAARAKIRAQMPDAANLQEETLEQLMALVGNEAIQQSLAGQDLKQRNASVKILLKRADQKRFDRRMQFLESREEKAKKVLSDEKLSPDQIKQKMKQIFGQA